MVFSIVNFVDYEDVSVTDSVGTLSSDKINSIGGTYQMAFITVEGDTVRVKLDGSDPTATSGHMLGSGDTFEVYGKENLLNFKFILSDGGSSATLRVTYGYFG